VHGLSWFAPSLGQEAERLGERTLSTGTRGQRFPGVPDRNAIRFPIRPVHTIVPIENGAMEACTVSRFTLR